MKHDAPPPPPPPFKKIQAEAPEVSAPRKA